VDRTDTKKAPYEIKALARLTVVPASKPGHGFCHDVVYSIASLIFRQGLFLILTGSVLVKKQEAPGETQTKSD